MTTTTRTTVLRKFNKAELAALKETARERFYNTQHGYDQYAFTDPKTGRAIGGFVEGAYIPVLVVQATEILRTYKAQLAQGYTLHELEIIPFHGQSMNIYFYRPQAELDLSLEKIYQRVTDEYNAVIETENNDIIERQVQLHLANTARLKAEELAAEAQAEEAKIREEVAEALRTARQTVMFDLEAKS